jgi:hypothetical protein
MHFITAHFTFITAHFTFITAQIGYHCTLKLGMVSSTIPDSAISLPNFNVIRNDRSSSCGGGVICIFINNSIYCQRLTAFEDPTVESLWLLVRPTWLPRSTSVILLAVIYHSTSAGHTENVNLYSHIQTNVDTFMQSHPDGLVLITGDINYRSTGFNAKYIQRSMDLSPYN